MNHIENLQWRYATKRMNGEKINEESLQNLLTSIQLAPSSLGLQPLKILVFDSIESKEKLSKACGQPQILESSQVLCFCIWETLKEKNIDEYIANISKIRAQEISELMPFKMMIKGFTDAMDQLSYENWASKQAYISLGFGMYAAAMEQIDATPMEGFDNKALDSIFDLSAKGLKSVVLLAIGKRDETTDYLFHAKKVRKSKEELFQFL